MIWLDAFRAVYSRYQKSRDLVQVGAYMSGSDPALDEAIRLQPQMAACLQQDMFDAASMDQSVAAMAAVLGPVEHQGDVMLCPA